FLNRPAESRSELFPNKERILDTRARGRSRVHAEEAELRRIGGTFEARERRHVVIAEEKEGAAVKLIRAGSSDDIHSSGRDGPGGKVEGQRADLELLHRLRREILRSAAGDTVVDPSPINRNQSHGLRGAVNRDLEEVIGIAGAGIGSIVNRHTGLERGHGKKTPSVQRQT